MATETPQTIETHSPETILSTMGSIKKMLLVGGIFAGVGYLLGPTGGFLIGFVVAAAVIGFVAHRSLTPDPIAALSPVWVTAALLAGLVAVYLIGVPWLATVNGLALTRAAAAMATFAVGDLAKTALTVGILAGGNELLADLR